MSDVLYRTRDGDMLDAICHQHYGRQSGAVEQVLQHNPGLAALGPVYQANVLITLKPLPKPVETQTIRLWD